MKRTPIALKMDLPKKFASGAAALTAGMWLSLACVNVSCTTTADRTTAAETQAHSGQTSAEKVDDRATKFEKMTPHSRHRVVTTPTGATQEQ